MDATPTTPPGSTKSRNGEDKIDRSQTDWYRDAIIYQLHIKAYFDSDGNGMGDFAGLIDRLDYIASLGVTAIWLLPFYPSPMRDDGYDIADYRAINPVYGTMRDFRRFVAEAHKRGIRVIIELVINHTSDQHAWFQKARRAKPGSVARDYYVWSDTDKRYAGTRIIFIDTEQSNWTWDPVAHAFFWHRFYSHQPDLNFDNPHVMAEVKRLMHYWLDTGVDGLRLDAIPYLVERDGTNNENLPETHVVLRELRRELDASYPDRMLLAEANQWPEDTRPYFGEGDECHMAFHFPLMPRMYMALAQEDRHPITDIIRQTPDIPENCQWAIFLRNHDELTLEMVTAEERDYLWRTYASDSRARINLGIRRRLAPLLENDRRKIELMNGLLLSMPGTPVVYYGDELGMGDNYFLGDRDGVRTPMQWSADRNGGFSRANPQQLYLPPIMDPVYGFQAVNVEAQNTEASSLLNWMRRMISVRKQHPAFGRGTLTILLPQNRKILAYVREHENERILCVVNLSRAAQAVELDLSDYRGAVPVELAGNAAFPPIGTLPYMLTLPAYGFFWFLLAPEADAPSWHTQMPDPLPEFITLTAAGGNLARVLEGRELTQFQRYVLPEFLGHQNWFRGGTKRVKRATVTPIGALPGAANQLLFLDVEPVDDRPRRYFLPVTVLWGEENLHLGAPKLSYTLARLRHGPTLGALIDASFDERFHWDLVKAMRDGVVVPGNGGTLVFEFQSRIPHPRTERQHPPGRHRGEGRRLHRRQQCDDEGLSAPDRRRAPGGFDRPLPHRGRRLPPHAGILRQPPVQARRGRAGDARCRLHLYQQPGRRLERHTGGARPQPRSLRAAAARRRWRADRPGADLRVPARPCRHPRQAHRRAACRLRHADRGPALRRRADPGGGSEALGRQHHTPADRGLQHLVAGRR